MLTAKLFEKDGGQAVQLPTNCHFNGNEVFVSRIGDIVVITPKDSKWASFLSNLETFKDDFMCDERVM